MFSVSTGTITRCGCPCFARENSSLGGRVSHTSNTPQKPQELRIEFCSTPVFLPVWREWSLPEAYAPASKALYNIPEQPPKSLASG
jgi:hypothetical protein